MAAAAFEKDIGTKPFVAWNVQVSYVFDSEKIGHHTIRDLENRAIRISATSFKSKPAQITVSATWKQ